MSTFSKVKERDEDQYGEYRTGKTILEIFDRMTESDTTGRPYQSLLDLPTTPGPLPALPPTRHVVPPLPGK